MKNKKKANVGINTIFYIMMSIFMVSILIFGFNKIFLVKDQLSKQELLELREEIVNLVEYCNDPLNVGNSKTDIIKNKNFDAIFVLGDGDFYTSHNCPISQFYDINTIHESGDNIVFAKMTKKSVSVGSGLIIDEIDVIDSFKIINQINNTCWVDTDSDGTIEIEIKCI